MGDVAILTELVRDRIAAGEVVERPASAVKELVENALDARASRIDVEIEAAGKRLIRVSDDGVGMNVDDLTLCVERFATSKINSERDLQQIDTMGFRGEALPSIASVAELSITTCIKGAHQGYRLALEPGSTERIPEPAPASQGTTVEVRNLFARTPARLKFLRRDATETSEIILMVERLALANPNIAFSMKTEKRTVFTAPKNQTLRERSSVILGESVTKTLIDIKGGNSDWLGLEGLVSAPGGHTRGDSKWGFMFLNRRPIKDRTIAHAARAAYESIIPPRRQPVFILALSIDPAEADINVHPTKQEVRFSSSRSVHELVRRSIREALRNAGAEISVGYHAPIPTRQSIAEPRPRPPREIDLFDGLSDSPTEDLTNNLATATTDAPQNIPVINEALQKNTQDAPPTLPKPAEQTAKSVNEKPEEYIKYSPNEVRVVGTLNSGYVLVETPDDLRIVDPHAIHERLIYDSLIKAREAKGHDSQMLLVPEVVELTSSEAAVFDWAGDAMRMLGFEVELFGPRTVAVRAVPTSVPSSASGDILREVLLDLEEGGKGNTASRLDRVSKSIACRAAVKLGAILSREEIETLLRDASKDTPPTCPHGRPYWFVLPLSEIARRLGRE